MYGDTEKEYNYRINTLGMREKDFHKENIIDKNLVC